MILVRIQFITIFIYRYYHIPRQSLLICNSFKIPINKTVLLKASDKQNLQQFIHKCDFLYHYRSSSDEN